MPILRSSTGALLAWLTIWQMATETDAALAQVDLAAVDGIGVYSVVEKSKVLAPDVSEFLAGYLGNVKNYATYNLDQHYVRSVEGAQGKATELGADALLVARVKGFGEHENTGKAELRLLDIGSGETLLEWSATLEAPYFDPPMYSHSQPYGNLDQVFAELPVKSYEAPVKIRLLVVSDQRLRGPGRSTKDYLVAQLELASRVMEREFGVELVVEKVKRWSPPDAGIYGIARAAAGIRGREEVDLTLVCLGPPAPTTYRKEKSTVLGYARVLTNIVVTSVMNGHVFVHEIGHVLGAIHMEKGGNIMHPRLQTYALGERFKILPHMEFTKTNRRIINTTKALSLGADYQNHREKIDQLISIYEELKGEHLERVAPYYGGLLMDFGRLDEAVDLLQTAVVAAPNDRINRVMLREALEKAGRYEEARELLQEDFDVLKAGWEGITKGRVKIAGFAKISVSKSLLLFGQTAVGKGANKQIVVSNIGTETLEIKSIVPPDEPFSLGEDTPETASLEPGKALEIEVKFQPEASGAHQGYLEIFSNSSKKSTAVRLTGQGIK